MSDQEGRYDWVLRGGEIVDGTGAPRYQGDLAIQGQIIADLGNLGEARGDRVVDASGRIVCPGIVDVHTHSDIWLLSHPMNEAKLRQGVTTEILGLDGISHFPASPKTQATINELWSSINGYLPVDQQNRSIGDILSRLDRRTAANTAFLVPHLTVRIEVMGLAQRAADPSEIGAMQEIVYSAMAQGAIGLSTGLNYWPANYATTEELIALCEVVAGWGGVYVTHLRDYRDRIVDAIEEAAAIGKVAVIPVHLSHLNHRAQVVLPPIERALSDGVDLSFDHYPYLVGHTLLSQFLPTWIFAEDLQRTIEKMHTLSVRERLLQELVALGVDWSNYRLCYVPAEDGHFLEGLTLPAAAKKVQKEVVELIYDLLLSTRFGVSVLVNQTYRTEEDVKILMRHPAQMFASDAIYIGGHLHPRAFGTYPRVLDRYVRQHCHLTWEEAVRKMTSIPAKRFGFRQRGVLQKGMTADILLINPNEIRSPADYDHPHQFPEGIESIWVNGEQVLNPDGPTKATPGRALKPFVAHAAQ